MRTVPCIWNWCSDATPVIWYDHISSSHCIVEFDNFNKPPSWIWNEDRAIEKSLKVFTWKCIKTLDFAAFAAFQQSEKSQSEWSEEVKRRRHIFICCLHFTSRTKTNAPFFVLFYLCPQTTLFHFYSSFFFTVKTVKKYYYWV